MDQKLTNRLRGFFDTWTQAQSRDAVVRRLTDCFAQIRELRPEPPGRMRRVAPEPQQWQTMFAALAPPAARLRAEGGTLNPWSVAGLKRQEVRNAAVLATLWSPQVCGDGATDFFDAFCRRLSEWSSAIPTSEDVRAGYTVQREHCVVGETSERVDLTIEGRTFVLGIEVKIDAGEGPDQLARYVASVERWGRQRGKRPLVVFLAPYRTGRADVVPAGWNDVVAAARTVVPRLLPGSTYHQQLLDGFVRHIGKFGG